MTDITTKNIAELLALAQKTILMCDSFDEDDNKALDAIDELARRAEEAESLRRERDEARGAAVHAFIKGADWLRFKLTGFTSFPSERDEAEAEAVKRFPFAPTDYRIEIRALRTEVERLTRESGA